jgi:hypothetical protein
MVGRAQQIHARMQRRDALARVEAHVGAGGDALTHRRMEVF